MTASLLAAFTAEEVTDASSSSCWPDLRQRQYNGIHFRHVAGLQFTD